MVERTHPLAAVATTSPDCAAVQLAAMPPATRLILRGDVADMALPEICRAIVRDNESLLWLGPDEYLLLASGEIPPTLNAASVVNVSHRDTSLSISGPRAAWVINAFCALDLHLSAFPVGMCTRTVFGKAEIVLWRTASETFRIEVARSIAPYVWACLEEARREFLD
jgi:heterotetrameric sarcosine oxidase gamma subunit